MGHHKRSFVDHIACMLCRFQVQYQHLGFFFRYREMFNFLRNNEELSIERLADEMKMSQRTFARHFRAATGTTPHQWLLQQRILQAQSLLERTDESIERIASLSGFSSATMLRIHNVPFWKPRHFNGSGGKKDCRARQQRSLNMPVIVNSTSFLLLVFIRATWYTPYMKQTLTAKLKLKTTPEHFAALRTTQLAYRDALNFVSRYSFEHGKISSNAGLQKGTYYDVRAQFKLPSQMTCTVMRDVAASYKGCWTKARHNAAARKAGHTKKRYKGLDTPPTFVSPTLTYQNGKDYSFKVNQQVSILTQGGRVVVPYQGYHAHIQLIQHGAEIGTAKLWYDQPHKQYYLLVSFEVERPDPTPEQQTQVMGVDVGVRYLAVTSDYKGEPTFHAGKQVRNRANHYARLRKRLQKKGTRSATRRLKAISGRERRLKANANHTISRRILQENPHALIGIEELTHIRERTKRRTHKRRKNGTGVERASVKQRKSNRVYSQWSFAELHGMLAYKAVLSGSMVVKVDANDTSKGCPKCGHIDDANRPNKGLLFCCVNCRYTLHADLIAARNIVMRTLLVRQDWARTGLLSVAPGSSDPDVSAVEAKAARLRRYAELRWKPDTSPWSKDQGVS